MINYKAFYLLPSNDVYKIEHYTESLEKINKLISNENLIALKLVNAIDKETKKPIMFLDEEMFIHLGSSERGCELLTEKRKSKVVKLYS